MRTGLTIALGLVAMTNVAQAQSPDLQRQLDARLATLTSASPQPATWRARIAEFRNWIANAKAADGSPLPASERDDAWRDQIASLDRAIAQTRLIAPAPARDAILGEACLARVLDSGCGVTASGTLHGENGMKILWQIQSGASRSEGIGAGVMLWDASKPGAPQPIGWSFEGVTYRPPILTDDGLLWVEGRRMGTGNGNADLVYQWRDGRWVEIETVSWRAELEAKLPAGLGAWKGIDYRPEYLGGFTYLWRTNDGNCCPTGGTADLRFEISGDRLKLVEVRAQTTAAVPAAPAGS